MDNVLRVVSSLFGNIFVSSSYLSGISFLNYIILRIQAYPYLFLGVVLIIIGFSISIIKRLIHS